MGGQQYVPLRLIVFWLGLLILHLTRIAALWRTLNKNLSTMVENIPEGVNSQTYELSPVFGVSPNHLFSLPPFQMPTPQSYVYSFGSDDAQKFESTTVLSLSQRKLFALSLFLAPTQAIGSLAAILRVQLISWILREKIKIISSCVPLDFERSKSCVAVRISCLGDAKGTIFPVRDLE